MSSGPLPPFARGIGPPLEPGMRPTRAKHAASLILIRQASSQYPEVLLGRRAGKHRFLPNVYAFPGGRVDLSDVSSIEYNPFNIKTKKSIINSKCELRLASALGIAALRETWEETGLLVGKIHDQRFVPDLSHLHYLGRAITPVESPIRFHARFFLADAKAASGTLGGSGELLDLAFRPLPEALKLPLADITEFWLRQLSTHPVTDQPDRTAFWHYRKRRPVVTWE